MFDLITSKDSNVKNDVLSGITVALALVPEAVAFAFVAGVEPMIGLYAAFMMGLITSAIGGRPGMISGATGAMAVVMVALVAQHGVQYLFAAVILAGLLQIMCGIFKLGKFIRLVPYPVTPVTRKSTNASSLFTPRIILNDAHSNVAITTTNITPTRAARGIISISGAANRIKPNNTTDAGRAGV